jgi:hypothetical protein
MNGTTFLTEEMIKNSIYDTCYRLEMKVPKYNFKSIKLIYLKNEWDIEVCKYYFDKSIVS